LGDIEGQNLVVERYSGEGRPGGFADLAREVVSRNPEVIVVSNDVIAQAARAASGTIPIVWVTGGDPIQSGLVTSLARPGGNLTGVTVQEGGEIWGKRLQILKEAFPSASRVAFLGVRTDWEGMTSLRAFSQQLQISVASTPLKEATPSEVRRVFAEIAQDRPDAIMADGRAELLAHHQLIVELANKSRLAAMYPWRDYAEAGGLMAYGGDLGETGRRAADDVHEILNGAKAGDIPIYRPTIYELVINLKTAKAPAPNMTRHRMSWQRSPKGLPANPRVKRKSRQPWYCSEKHEEYSERALSDIRQIAVYYVWSDVFSVGRESRCALKSLNRHPRAQQFTSGAQYLLSRITVRWNMG
jgi:putative tryptophan/tyrosine transport system substrate-binding protein